MAEKSQLPALKNMLAQDNIKNQFKEILGKRSAGFISSIISAVASNKALKENTEPLSIISAASIAATIDLPINPSLGFAHIVPYKGQAQFQMGWRGYVQLAIRTGMYSLINTSEVFEGELVSQNHITGEMIFDPDQKKSEKVIGYVSYFKLVSGFENYFYMTVAELEAHGKKYSASYSKDFSKWKTDFPAMAKKTVIKLNLSKYGIMSIEMQKAVSSDQAVIDPEGNPLYPDNESGAGTGKPKVQAPEEITPVEELVNEKTGEVTDPAPAADPAPDSTDTRPITAGQEKKIYAMCKAAGMDVQKLKAAYTVDSLKDLNRSEASEIFTSLAPAE